MHHRSYFLPEVSFSNIATQFAVESKDFLPHKVDWFKDLIPAPETFEEGNMANISPVIQMDIVDSDPHSGSDPLTCGPPHVDCANSTCFHHWNQHDETITMVTLLHYFFYVIFCPFFRHR